MGNLSISLLNTLKQMKHFIYTILLVVPFFLFSSCDDILEEVDFKVTTEKTSFEVGEEVVFSFSDTPNWVTFYSGEEGKTYPESYGTSVKSMINELLTYTYTYNEPGSYKVVFEGGNTNYQGSNKKVVTLTIQVN